MRRDGRARDALRATLHTELSRFSPMARCSAGSVRRWCCGPRPQEARAPLMLGRQRLHLECAMLPASTTPHAPRDAWPPTTQEIGASSGARSGRRWTEPSASAAIVDATSSGRFAARTASTGGCGARPGTAAAHCPAPCARCWRPPVAVQSAGIVGCRRCWTSPTGGLRAEVDLNVVKADGRRFIGCRHGRGPSQAATSRRCASPSGDWQLTPCSASLGPLVGSA